MALLFVFTAVQQAVALSVHHNLKIRIYPQQNRLTGIDDMQVRPEGSTVLEFSLTEKASQVEAMINGKPAELITDRGRHRVLLPAGEGLGLIPVRVLYSAIFDDPVPMLPVSVDNPGYGVTATISEQGTLLLPGAGWYPQIAPGRSTYRVEIKAPEGILAVTAGRSLGHQTRNGFTVSTWDINHPVRGISLSAARYVVQEQSAGNLVAATYFFTESQHLTTRYLETTIQYLQLYEALFGPYPFAKFAVVENFFPTGYGFSSYTLLGSRVLRLPFIVRTSLGHEVAHCWWGNGVYVDYARGNWSEGLTTYVADYLFQEKASKETARRYRQQMLRNYASLVQPDNDFPLRSFQNRYSPATKTIGYDKGAMVFHMLREMIGERDFWGGLRDLYQERLFQVVSWSDIQTAFERRGKRSLQRFFNQWVFQAGAPLLKFEGVSAKRIDDSWKVRGRIVQRRPYYRFKADLLLETATQKIVKTVDLAGKVSAFEIHCRNEPLKLTFDPNVNIFRRLDSSEIPPSINSLKGASSVLVVLADGLQPGFRAVVDMLKASLGLKKADVVAENKVSEQKIAGNDILLIGLPRHQKLLSQITDKLMLDQEAFSLNGTSYHPHSDNFFGVFSHPFARDRVVAVFFPVSSPYAATVARKITHYGKYSYLAFSEGQNRDKGIWPVINSPLVYHW